MTETRERSLIERCEDTTPRDSRNLMRILWTLGAWALTFLAATMGFKRGLVPEGPMSWVVAALPTLLGILVILAYARFLRESDELQRVIHHQALALGFGAGWLALMAYAVFEKMGVSVFGTDTITLAMMITYSLWIVLGRLRYR